MKYKNHAIIGIPNQLFIIVILMSILFLLLFYAVTNFQKQTQINDLKKNMNQIINSAEYLTEYANHASIISSEINIPQIVKFVSFGPPPEYMIYNTNYNNISLFNERMYVICYENDIIEQYHTSFPFYIDHTNNSCILTKGSHQINMELIQTQGKTYVKIQQKG
ncbi:MAG: hypothetical protein DRN27_08790 [Thermoplasmata archaeon]|nr:MAG: hypothetical protein DRN27_08790 [Thermoplasmata archaeon]